MKNVLLVVKKDGREALEVAREVMEYLNERGINTTCDVATGRNMDIQGIDPGEAPADLMLVLGGDGTLLWAESKISGKGIPILGMNFGTTGFLTEINPENWKQAIDRVLSGRYTIERRKKIDVRINGAKAGTALNEVVVKTAVPVEMLNLEIRVDEQEVETVMADGLIVATPTGSTAYSMSVGGPIVDTRVRAFIITSISPFKLGARPLVVPDTSKISIRIKGKQSGVVVIDGESRKEVSSNDEILCALSKDQTYFVKLEKDFYEKIRRRLRR
ncbi:MAG: NAD(+) kinase [Methanobacteriota archaeon]|nr:MAG: NAD(+) kinase [Euryarchaeota archaeon]